MLHPLRSVTYWAFLCSGAHSFLSAPEACTTTNVGTIRVGVVRRYPKSPPGLGFKPGTSWSEVRAFNPAPTGHPNQDDKRKKRKERSVTQH